MSNSSEFAAMSPKHVPDAQDSAFRPNKQESNKLNDEAANLLSDKSILNNIDRAARAQAESAITALSRAEQHRTDAPVKPPVNAKEVILLKQLALVEKKYGEVSKEAAAILEKLGLVCIQDGRYGKAKQYIEKALKIDEVVYGKDSIQAGGCHAVLGVLDVKLGNNDAAAKEFETAIDIARKNKPLENTEAARLLVKTAAAYINEILNKSGDEQRIKALFREMQLVVLIQGGRSVLTRNPDGTVTVDASWL